MGEEVKRTKKIKALVTGLKCHMKYEFKIIATNSLMMSPATDGEGETDWSKVALGVLGGLLTALLEDKAHLQLSTSAKVGLCAATAPISILLAPVTAPIGIAYGTLKDQQDISPVSEDES